MSIHDLTEPILSRPDIFDIAITLMPIDSVNDVFEMSQTGQASGVSRMHSILCYVNDDMMFPVYQSASISLMNSTVSSFLLYRRTMISSQQNESHFQV